MSRPGRVAADWQLDPGYPRERLGLLFVVGGVASSLTATPALR